MPMKSMIFFELIERTNSLRVARNDLGGDSSCRDINSAPYDEIKRYFPVLAAFKGVPQSLLSAIGELNCITGLQCPKLYNFWFIAIHFLLLTLR